MSGPAGGAHTQQRCSNGGAAAGGAARQGCAPAPRGGCGGAGAASQSQVRGAASQARGAESQVRGAAGSTAAAIRAANSRASSGAADAAKGNWLTSLGSKVMKARQRRVLAADGEELRLPEGVSASHATGKLHFAVSFRFNEVRCCPPSPLAAAHCKPAMAMQALASGCRALQAGHAHARPRPWLPGRLWVHGPCSALRSDQWCCCVCCVRACSACVVVRSSVGMLSRLVHVVIAFAEAALMVARLQGYTNAVKRPLLMQDLFPAMPAQQRNSSL